MKIFLCNSVKILRELCVKIIINTESAAANTKKTKRITEKKNLIQSQKFVAYNHSIFTL